MDRGTDGCHVPMGAMGATFPIAPLLPCGERWTTPNSHSPISSSALSRHPDTDSTTWLRGLEQSNTFAEESSFHCSLSHGTDSGLATSPTFSAREGTPSPGGSTEVSATSVTILYSASRSITSTRRSHAGDNGAMGNVAPTISSPFPMLCLAHTWHPSPILRPRSSLFTVARRNGRRLCHNGFAQQGRVR